MLPPEAIIEFKQIYRDEFGVELENQEATEKAINVFNLFDAIYRYKTLDKEKRKCHHED